MLFAYSLRNLLDQEDMPETLTEAEKEYGMVAPTKSLELSNMASAVVTELMREDLPADVTAVVRCFTRDGYK